MPQDTPPPAPHSAPPSVRRSGWRGFAVAVPLVCLAGAAYLGVAGVSVYRAADGMLQADAAPPQGQTGDPLAALGLPFETLAIQTDLGPSEAWLIPEPFRPSAPQPHQAVVFVHDRAGARTDGYRYLPALQAAGLPSLLLSYRNDANAPASPDGLSAYGLTEWADLEAALLALRDRGYSDIIVLADGMGATIVGQTLARSPEAARISAVVLWAPDLRYRAALEETAQAQGWPLPRLVAASTAQAMRVFHPLDLHLADVTEPLATFSGPLMIAVDPLRPDSARRSHQALIAKRDQAGLGDLTIDGQTEPSLDQRGLSRFLELANRP